MAFVVPHGWDEIVATYGALEFGPDGRVTAQWEREHLASFALPYPFENHAAPSAPPLKRIYCHRLVGPILQETLNEILRAGLHVKDVGDPRYDGLYAYGGCWNVRPIRGRPGFWSLHSFAAAIDCNPKENPLGFAGRMHPEVVRIFRGYEWKHGGDFTRRDPQHQQLATGW